MRRATSFDACSSSRSSACKCGERRELLGDRRERLARRGDFRRFAIDALEIAQRARALALGDAQLGHERVHRFAFALDRFPTRLDLIEHRARAGARRDRRRERFSAAASRALASAIARATTSGSGIAGAKTLRLRFELLLLFADEVLRVAQTLVAEHAREKLRAFRRAHRRHDAELFLPGEIGVEELVCATCRAGARGSSVVSLTIVAIGSVAPSRYTSALVSPRETR